MAESWTIFAGILVMIFAAWFVGHRLKTGKWISEKLITGHAPLSPWVKIYYFNLTFGAGLAIALAPTIFWILTPNRIINLEILILMPLWIIGAAFIYLAVKYFWK